MGLLHGNTVPLAPDACLCPGWHMCEKTATLKSLPRCDSLPALEALGPPWHSRGNLSFFPGFQFSIAAKAEGNLFFSLLIP